MEVTCSEFIHNVAKYQDAALHTPVIITRYGRPQTVLVSAVFFDTILKTRVAAICPGGGEAALAAIAQALGLSARERENDISNGNRP